MLPHFITGRECTYLNQVCYFHSFKYLSIQNLFVFTAMVFCDVAAVKRPSVHDHRAIIFS